jgi:hypothetical protein
MAPRKIMLFAKAAREASAGTSTEKQSFFAELALSLLKGK